jgi:hypothetical protein
MRNLVKTKMNIQLSPNDSALSSQLIRYINNTTATMRQKLWDKTRLKCYKLVHIYQTAEG